MIEPLQEGNTVSINNTWMTKHLVMLPYPNIKNSYPNLSKSMPGNTRFTLDIYLITSSILYTQVHK